jgi:hypothetical protein
MFKFYENCIELKLPDVKGDITQFLTDFDGAKKDTRN